MVSGITSGSRKKVGVPASSEEDCNRQVARDLLWERQSENWEVAEV